MPVAHNSSVKLHAHAGNRFEQLSKVAAQPLNFERLWCWSGLACATHLSKCAWCCAQLHYTCSCADIIQLLLPCGCCSVASRLT